MDENAFNPYKIWLTILLIGGIILVFHLFLPKEGLIFKNTLLIKHYQLPFLSANDTVCISSVKQTSEEIVDSPNTIKSEELPTQTNNNLTYNKLQEKKLREFYKKLQANQTSLHHILHFGDSQLDGDRISNHLRLLYQAKYGGSAIGFTACLDETQQNGSILITSHGTWQQKWLYNHQSSTTDEREAFGLLGNYSEGVNAGSITFKLSEQTKKNRVKIRLYATPTNTNQIVNCIADDVLFQSDTVNSYPITTIQYDFPYQPSELKLNFSTDTTPKLHGIEFLDSKGVDLHNIALRGQLFTRFLNQDSTLVREMIANHSIDLILLQFGANILPTYADNYRGYEHIMRKQLQFLKELFPQTPIVVIGVGDAAAVEDGVLKTRSNVESIVNAQKRAAIESGALFFDLYRAMGGAGTIIKWSNETPKRAMSDYIHFNNKGGKEVASLIFNALETEFNQPLQTQRDE